MDHRIILILFMPVIIMLSACKYGKGDIYTDTLQGDSLKYVILAKGSGNKLLKKATQLKLRHEYKGNVCQIKYVSDSATFASQKGILLFNSVLPDIKNDILTKGFIGAFASRQDVIYLLVSRQDFKQYFRKTKL